MNKADSGTLDKGLVKHAPPTRKGGLPDWVELSGRLTLNYVDILCNVRVNYSSMEGVGHITVLGEQ